jgi:sRNA-binding protein
MSGRPRISGTLTLPGFKVKTTPTSPSSAPSISSIPPPPPPADKSSKPRAPELVKVFAEKWPGAFGAGATKPLAIGIHAEIKAALADTTSNKQLSETLRWWVSRDSYLTALSQPDARRRGLDGSDAGPVSDNDREMAAKQLAERRARR